MFNKLFNIFKKCLIYKEIFFLIFSVIILLYPLLLYPYYTVFLKTDITFFTAWKFFLIENIHSFGTIPLWNTLFFSGSTFIGNIQAAIYYPINIIYFFMPVERAFSAIFLLDYILITIFSYFYAREIKLSKGSSLIVALSIAFNGAYMKQLFLGHIVVIDAIIWFPLMLLIYEKILKKFNRYLVILSGITFGLMILGGHIQMPIFELIGFTAYFYLRLIQKRKEKIQKIILFVPLFTLLIGCLLTAIQLIPTLELIFYSVRSKGIPFDFASAFSLHPKQIIAIVAPSFFGNDLNNTYWGIGSFWSSSIYAGVITFFLSLFSLKRIKNNFVSIFILFFIISLLFSFGKYFPLFNIFYKYVPFFSNFRVPTRILFIYSLSIGVLAGFGFEYIKYNLEKRKKIFIPLIYKLLTLSISMTFVGIAFFVYLSANLHVFNELVLKSSYAQGLNHTELINLIVNDLMFIFIILCTVLLFTILYSKKIITIKKLTCLILLLIVIDYFHFYTSFFNLKAGQPEYQFQNELSFIAKDSSKFRILSIPTIDYDLTAKYNLESISGLDPIHLSSYRNFFWQIGDHDNAPYESFIDIKNINNIDNLKLLNVKYVISKNQITNENLKLVYKYKYSVYELTSFYPRVYLLNNIGQLNLKDLSNLKFSPDLITLETNPKTNARLILSEIYYPGWAAYDNGKKINISEYKQIFRSISLTPGEHKIKFVYKPYSYELGKSISLLSIFIIIIILLPKTAYFKRS